MFRAGILATTLYFLLLLALIYFYRDEFAALGPNEWGDFLAGTFGPLALLWVVLGFFLQSHELRNSIRALELQTDELKSSVEAQNSLAESSKTEIANQLAARKADLALEIHKSMVDLEVFLKDGRRRLKDLPKKIDAYYSATGNFLSGARELKIGEARSLELEFQNIASIYKKEYPLAMSDLRSLSVRDAGMLYDLKNNAKLLHLQAENLETEISESFANYLAGNSVYTPLN